MHECQYCGRSTCNGTCSGDLRDAYERGRLAGLEEATREIESAPLADYLKGAFALAIRLRKEQP